MTAHDLILEVSQQLPGVSMEDFFKILKRRVNELFKCWRWRHYEGDYQFHLQASYSTGTASVTNGLKAVTGVDTVWASEHDGCKIQFAGSDHWYTIDAVGGATSITLLEAFFETTLSGATYTIYKDEYAVPTDFHRLSYLQNLDDESVYTSEEYYLFEGDKIRFYDYPTEAEPLILFYRRKPTHADTPDDTVDIPACLDEAIVYAMLDTYMVRQAPIDPWLARISMNKADLAQAIRDAKSVDNSAGGIVTRLKKVAFQQ